MLVTTRPWAASAKAEPAYGFQVEDLTCEVSILEPGRAEVVYRFRAVVCRETLGDINNWAFHMSEKLTGAMVDGKPIPFAENKVDDKTHSYSIHLSQVEGLGMSDRFACVLVTERLTPSICWHDYIGTDALHIMLWRLNEFRHFASPQCRFFDVRLNVPDDWAVFWATPLGSGGPIPPRAFTLPAEIVQYNTWVWAGPFVQLHAEGATTLYGFAEAASLAKEMGKTVASRHEAVLSVLRPGAGWEPTPMQILLFQRAPGSWGVGAPGFSGVNHSNLSDAARFLDNILGHELVHCYLAPAAGIDVAGYAGSMRGWRLMSRTRVQDLGQAPARYAAVAPAQAARVHGGNGKELRARI